MMVKQFIGKAVRRVAPRTIENLVYVSRVRAKGSDVIEALRVYESDLKDLKTELDEMRRDQRRMAELYDLVFERVRSDSAKTDAAPEAVPDAAPDAVKADGS